MASETVKVILGGIKSEERRLIENLLVDAYPTEQHEIQVADNVSQASIFIGVASTDPRYVLVLLSDYYYRKIIPDVPDTIKLWDDGGIILKCCAIEKLKKKLSDRWLSDEAWQKKVDEYYAIEPVKEEDLPFSLEDFNKALETNATLKKEVEDAKNAKKQIASLKSELEVVYSENERLRNTQIQIGEYTQLEMKLNATNLKTQRLEEERDDALKDLKEARRQIVTLKEEVNSATEAGYAKAKKDLADSGYVSEEGIYSALGTDIEAQNFTDLTLDIDKKFANVHVCFSATESCHKLSCNAIIKHMTSIYNHNKNVGKDILFIDLSSESYTQLYLSHEDRIKGEGYRWLLNPTLSLGSYKNSTTTKYIQTLFVNRGEPYNTLWLLSLPWERILNTLNNSDFECYIYLGPIGISENRILYSSFARCTDTIILVDGAQPEIVVLYNIIKKLILEKETKIFIYQKRPNNNRLYDRLKQKHSNIKYINVQLGGS